MLSDRAGSPALRRPSLALVACRWRCEAAIVLAVSAGIGAAATWAGARMALATLAALAGLAVVISRQVRQFAIARAWCIITPHRVRACFAKSWICNLAGQMPAVLRATATPTGERVVIWCPAGTSFQDIDSACELLAAACWATEVTAHRSRRFAQLVHLYVIRRPRAPTLASATGDWRTRNLTRVAISAHSASGAPVTRESFQEAVLSGAEYVEFDVRKTRDGTLVAFHNAAAGNSGLLVKDLTYHALCEIAGYPVPQVSEVMSMLAGKAIGHIDLKEPGYEDEVVELALAQLGGGNFIVTSLDDNSILRIKNSYPKVQAALSLGRDLAGMPMIKRVAARLRELLPLSRIRSCQADWVAVNHKLARLGVLRQCARHDIGTMIWTVNSDKLIDQLLTNSRVRVLVTDRPEHALRRRADLGAGTQLRTARSGHTRHDRP